MQNIKTEKQHLEETKLHDAYNDEYWNKKYGVSSSELKETGNIGIAAKIVNAITKNKKLVAEY